MSHFFVWILVPKATKPDALEDVVSTMLAPYDENLDVPEWDKECYCKRHKAQLDAMNTANEAVGHMDTIRDDFWKRPDMAALSKERNGLEFSKTKLTKEQSSRLKAIRSDINREWDAATAPWEAAKLAAYEAHPLKEQPDPECSECKGSGTYKSTYNPKSKWDWWRIGGRWDGVIQRKERESRDNGFNFSDEHQQPKHNAIAVAELLPLEDDDIPFAIVTPDGEWHEKGHMGWFACVSDEKTDWVPTAKDIIGRHADCLAVGCDLHI